MKTEEAIKKLNEHFGRDCLSVDVQDHFTHFRINLPHKWGQEIPLTFSDARVYNILQFGEYTSVLLSIKNSKLVLL